MNNFFSSKILKLPYLSALRRRIKRTPKVGQLVVIVTIGVIIFTHLSADVPTLAHDLKIIFTQLIQHPNLTAEDKLRERISVEFYDATKLIRQHTSVTSYLMHPPQMWPWAMSGNPEFAQYFLYPVKLIHEDRNQLFDLKSKVTHVMIAWGEGGKDELKGWPQFPVFAQKIYHLPQNRKGEVRGLAQLSAWNNNAERAINAFNGSKWDLTYTSSEYDYWMTPISVPVSPDTKFTAEVKSNWPNSTALIVQVDFGQGNSAVFSSSPNNKVGNWTTLAINDLYQRAIQFAQLKGWSTEGFWVLSVGVDTGHPAQMPYLDRYGLIEVEKGGEVRKEYLAKQIANNSNLLALGNISNLELDQNKAALFYQEASLLEPSNSWSYWGLAEVAKKTNNLAEAETDYKKAEKLSPKLSWFPYALGEFYQQKGILDKAEEEYQKSLNLNPGAFWTNRALGEVNESYGRYDIAYKYYLAASFDGGKDFTSDGKIAWEKAQKIKSEQEKIIVEKGKNFSEDWQTHLDLARAYTVLEQLDKAKEQYGIAYKLNPRAADMNRLPPQITDWLSKPSYGKPGLAVESQIIDGKKVVMLDNYHSYFQYDKGYFPPTNGTIDIFWKPTDDINRDKESSRNLLYQYHGIFVWMKNDKLSLAIFDSKQGEWTTISSSELNLDPNRWYRVDISYGSQGMFLYLDGQELAKKEIEIKIGEAKDVYLGRGPSWPISQKVISGYFDRIEIYDYQKFKWE